MLESHHHHCIDLDYLNGARHFSGKLDLLQKSAFTATSLKTTAASGWGTPNKTLRGLSLLYSA
jgi:hypothetical protein